MSDSEHSDAGLGGPIRSAPTEPYIPPGAAPVTATTFNPFAALGLDPGTATAADLRPAFLRAIRHRHEGTIARFPATAGLFPSQVQVNAAHDYLRAPGSLAAARNRWRYTHRAVFFPRLGLGDVGVFAASAAAPAAAAAAAAATPGPRRPAAAAAAAAAATATPNTGSSFRPSPSSSGGFFSGGSSGPCRNATNFANFADFAGSSSNNPFTFSSSSSDDDTANASPTPTNRRTRPSAANAAAATAATASGAAVSSAGGAAVSSASGAGARRAPARSSNRSGGSSMRNSSILNPVTNDRIIVGEWANATAATPNAVVAGFDTRGRIFYRVINKDINSNTVAAPTATATRFEDINFRAAYQNMTAGQVRTAIDQHLRLAPFLRP
jgi:hypothetical protein